MPSFVVKQLSRKKHASILSTAEPIQGTTNK